MQIVVYRLSDSFHSVWQELAAEFDVSVIMAEPSDAIGEGTIAIVLAAGGEEGRGLDVIPSINRGLRPLFMVGTNASHRFGVEAIRRGAADYFALPHDLDLLRRTIGGVVESAAQRPKRERRDAGSAFENLLGESKSLKATIDRAVRILPHRDVTVLITGETGTGKEVLARAMHEGGPRKAGRFVPVNCAAIPAALLESELFGHVRGAFTDAHQDKAGLFEEADGGTLFLDEIGHLPLDLQGKLLRVLEDKTIRRVGGNENFAVDVRILAATHVDLRIAVEDGAFRQDLFYRLNVVELELPALRDRGEDVLLLGHHFVETISARYGLPLPVVPKNFARALREHSWPGNVRELRHAIERALLLSDNGALDVMEMGLDAPGRKLSADAPLPFPATLRQITTAAAVATVELYDGNKSAAARALGVSRARLQRVLARDESDVDDAESEI